MTASTPTSTPLEIRDQFALAALVGLLASRSAGNPIGLAKQAYRLADAVLEVREWPAEMLEED